MTMKKKIILLFYILAIRTHFEIYNKIFNWISQNSPESKTKNTPKEEKKNPINLWWINQNKMWWYTYRQVSNIRRTLVGN